MKQINGKIINTNRTWPLLGKFCTHNNLFTRNKILFCDKRPLLEIGIVAYIVPEGKTFKTKKPILEVEKSVLSFSPGDVVSITEQGTASILWEVDTQHPALYVTDLCNSKCIMCPQNEGLSEHYDECLKLLDLIDLPKGHTIGITGGEPTLNMDRLVEILKKIAKKTPNTSVHILTNGRLFANPENVKKIASVEKIDVSFGVPLYSSIAEEHDYIVGVKGAFSETIDGIYNLGKYNQKIEIRVVVMRQNYKQLKLLANYIYRNLPFVVHVALMGMEYHGNAETNYDLVSIDAFDYKNNLFDAVREFVRYDMVVDVYNIPLCLVDSRIKNFCRDSISTWKKSYLPKCEDCKLKSECCGVFATSFTQSPHITPVLSTESGDADLQKG